MKAAAVDIPLEGLGVPFVLRAELEGKDGDTEGRELAHYIHTLLFAFEREGTMPNGTHDD